MFENQADSILLHQQGPDDSPILLMKDYDEYDYVDDVDNSIDTDEDHAGSSARHPTLKALDNSGMENTHPEDVPVALPSSLGWEWCVLHGAQSLAVKELQLRQGQANDSIHHIRLALGFKSALFRTQVRPAKTQTTKTRAWNAIYGVDTTVHEHAAFIAWHAMHIGISDRHIQMDRTSLSYTQRTSTLQPWFLVQNKWDSAINSNHGSGASENLWKMTEHGWMTVSYHMFQCYILVLTY
jgi:hypothetical protein